MQILRSDISHRKQTGRVWTVHHHPIADLTGEDYHGSKKCFLISVLLIQMLMQGQMQYLWSFLSKQFEIISATENFKGLSR